MRYRYDISKGATKIKSLKKKALAMPLALSAVLGAVVVVGGGSLLAVVGGPTCTVGATGADYATIQAAVDVPGCATIKVKAGNYNEHVVINRAVNLKGAKSGDSVDSRTFGAANESTVTGAGASDTPAFTVNAAGVTINGFSITNPSHGIGVTVKTAGNNAVVKNNIIDAVGTVVYPDNTVGVYLELGPDGVKVTGNKINNVSSVKSAQGVLVGDSTSTNPSLNTVLDSNTITNVTSTKGAYGIQANNGASSTGYSEVKIRGNTIQGLTGGWVHAIGLEGKTPNAVVRYNTISGLNSAGADKIGVYFESNPFFFTADVNRNSLNVGSSAFGIAVAPALSTQYPSLQVDGECNWWGAANGPSSVAAGSGSHVGPNVDYSPWLKTSNLNGRCGDRGKDDDYHRGDDDCKDDDKRGSRYND